MFTIAHIQYALCWELSNWERGYLAPLGQRPALVVPACRQQYVPLLSPCCLFVTILFPVSVSLSPIFPAHCFFYPTLCSHTSSMCVLLFSSPVFPELSWAKAPWIHSHNMRASRSTWTPCKQINLTSIRVARADVPSEGAVAHKWYCWGKKIHRIWTTF